MTTSPAVQIAPPPDGQMSPVAQTVVTSILGCIVLAALVIAVVAWSRTRRPLYPAMLLGGAIAAFNEPIVDVLGGCMHYRGGQWRAFETFDRPIPVWVVLAYVIFFGAVPLLRSVVLDGAPNPRARFWAFIGVIWVANLVIEIPVLRSGLYEYYGYQPFKLFGLFPAHWLFINELGVSTIVVVLSVLPRLFTGRGWVLALTLPSIAQLGAVAVCAVPIFSLYNTDAAAPWKWAAAVATMALATAATYGLSRLLPAGAAPRAASGAEPDRLPHPLTRELA